MDKHYNIGSNNGSYIDNRTNKTYYCIDCGKEISVFSGVYGQGRCIFCANKLNAKLRMKNRRNYEGKRNPFYGKKHSKLSKEKMGKSRLGKNNPNYIHGQGYEPYTKEYFIIRVKIYKRDNYTCQLCDIYPISCECHHINYDKENCDEYNLITLCHKCNNKVNHNRDYWFAYFTYIMEKIYA